jgi:dienelactone hydrolase
MRIRFLIAAVAVASGVGAMLAPHFSQAAPKMGGDYTDVVPIPLNGQTVKEIAGALFKPEGAGPFPVMVYIPSCGGPNFPLELQQEKVWIERLKAKGIATFIVDPFMPRGLENGYCPQLLTVLPDVQNKKADVLNLLEQSGSDAAAAVKAVKKLPGIDPNKVFVMGFSYGGTASLYATQANAPGDHDTDVAGVVAYFPLCAEDAEATVPTLVIIGDKDDWTGPPAACEALNGKGKFKVVLYPGATHAFTMLFDKPMEFAGHKMAHDEKASQDAVQRVEAFLDANLK